MLAICPASLILLYLLVLGTLGENRNYVIRDIFSTVLLLPLSQVQIFYLAPNSKIFFIYSIFLH
jgi:hypothetical protein